MGSEMCIRDSDKALVIEKATMPEQQIIPLREYTKSEAPYFSIILISEDHYE